MDATNATDALRERLARYPADRYPVQHATTQFNLGVALLDAGAAEEARETLAMAARLLDPERLPVEHAKAQNMLGAALRATGRIAEAAEAFSLAAALFESAGQPLERGAALFNLGLVERQTEEASKALDSFARARELLQAARAPLQASAAAREEGATLLALGRLEEAGAALEQAAALAERAGDEHAAGAAANLLGLVRLAAGRASEAVESFRAAAAAHPRSVRPAEFAMAKANLALAHERAGDVVRARLSARQALAVREAAEPVASQAAAVAERLGAPAGDVLALLDQEPPARWPALLREEVARWVDADSAERRAEAAAWIAGQAARPGHAALMAEAFLESLLELPPPAMDAVIRALLEALAGCDGEATARFHSETRRSMAGFQPPQERRLRQRFDRIAVELGQEPVWS